MEASNGNKLKCPKCRGHLERMFEYIEIRKLDVIKCVICGHRVAEREVVPVAERQEKKPQPVAPCLEKAPVPPTPRKEEEMERKLGRLRLAKGIRDTPPCNDCGRPGMKIVARGLCSACWTKHKKAGTLGNFESRGNGRPVKGAKKAGPAPPPYACPPKTKAEESLVQGQAALPVTVDQAPGVATVEAVGMYVSGGVIIQFEDERDSRLLERLLRDAHANRRSLDQQILFLVEQQLMA